MKEKLWQIIQESVLIKWDGSWDIMEPIIDKAIECYCELIGYNSKLLKWEVRNIEEKALNIYNKDLHYQGLMIEFIEFKLEKLKKEIEEG